MSHHAQPILREMCNECTNSGMRLSEWMDLRQVDDLTLGSMVEADRVTISRIRRGLNRPSWELAARIKRATNGAVTADDFLPLATERAAS